MTSQELLHCISLSPSGTQTKIVCCTLWKFYIKKLGSVSMWEFYIKNLGSVSMSVTLKLIDFNVFSKASESPCIGYADFLWPLSMCSSLKSGITKL